MMTAVSRASDGTSGMGVAAKGSAPRFHDPNTVVARLNALSGAMAPVMMIAVLLGT
jgi:hypothetical protein